MEYIGIILMTCTPIGIILYYANKHNKEFNNDCNKKSLNKIKNKEEITMNTREVIIVTKINGEILERARKEISKNEYVEICNRANICPVCGAPSWYARSKKWDKKGKGWKDMYPSCTVCNWNDFRRQQDKFEKTAEFNLPDEDY